jgi:putative endonuclease
VITSHSRGSRAETVAVWWLRLKGYRILARRFTLGRGTGAGEVDIIARRGQTLAFVEVKARATLDCAAQSVSPAQIRRITRGAEAFLATRPHLSRCRMRFDAVLVVPRWFPHHICDAWRIET